MSCAVLLRLPVLVSLASVVTWCPAFAQKTSDVSPRFTQVSGTPATTDRASTGGVTWVDYDGDGDLDLYVGNWPNAPGPEEANLLFRNDGPVGNWLALNLTGTSSNASAIGAVVRVTAQIGGQAVTQRREVAAHTSWRSQNALDVHVGLGDAARAETVEIIWPSGEVQRLANVEANQRITIREER